MPFECKIFLDLKEDSSNCYCVTGTACHINLQLIRHNTACYIKGGSVTVCRIRWGSCGRKSHTLGCWICFNFQPQTIDKSHSVIPAGEWELEMSLGSVGWPLFFSVFMSGQGKTKASWKVWKLCNRYNLCLCAGPTHVLALALASLRIQVLQTEEILWSS